MNKNNSQNGGVGKKILILIIIIIFAVTIIVIFAKRNKSELTNNPPGNSTVENKKPVIPNQPSPPNLLNLSAPIDRALERITKKPFGIKVSPDNSPVSPEHFTGYHTGVDFETFADEQDKDVPIFAICSGPLLLRVWASGYGGVVVQQCKLENQDIAVIYGHLIISSISAKSGEQISAGEAIGILGKGFSQETDGERKHLHLGIYKGTTINIEGYVQKPDELNNWIDATKYLE